MIRSLWACSVTVFVLTISAALPAAAAGNNIYLNEPDQYAPGAGDFFPAAIQPGDSGPWVRSLQKSLANAGFRPGERDGLFGGPTLGAVYAFQKVHDLPRDGVFLSEYWELLESGTSLPEAPDPDRVEIDLERQVLYLVLDQTVEAILPISSGNGGSYRGSRGTLVRATTPEGSYQFYRHIDGWRISYLGGLYRPFYFRGGYAVHGSRSVPPYPASHGCVRVELHDMDFLTTQLEIGMPIFVYGTKVTRADLFSSPNELEPAAKYGPWL